MSHNVSAGSGWLLAAALAAMTPGLALAQTAPAPPPARAPVAGITAAPLAPPPSTPPNVTPPAAPAPAAQPLAPQATAPQPPQAAQQGPSQPATPQPPQPAAAQGSPPAGSGTPTAGLDLPPQPAPPSLAPDDKRGFLNDIGHWWDQSVADFNAKVKEQQTKIDAFNKQSAAATQDAMKSAADAMRPSHFVEIQQVCPAAGNGAPDCATAANNVCKDKGYSAGQPLDIRTAEKCKASLWMSGQQTPDANDCPVETVLLRVACQ